MIRKLLYLFIIILLANCTYADVNHSTRVSSNVQFNKSCTEVYKNFRVDHAFSTYLKNRCILFESNRQQEVGLVLPFPNHREAGYNSKYPSLVAAYTEAINSQELKQIKALVTEYCKYNAYKFTKKAPQACNPQTIESLF